MIGQTISHFRILEKLGEGGMGVVYKAHDTNLDRDIALKFLPPGLGTHEPERARFLQEARAAGTLNHPNICTIHEVAAEGEHRFIVMECVDGVTLREKIAAGMMKVEECIGYAIQVGEALQEAHAHGIVHRDIKPENIKINSKNQIKVMDFGLAKLKGSMRLTRTSSTLGTAAYMSPEQARGEEVDERTDIWSFGAVFFQMLTGHLPFRGEHEAAMLYSIVHEDYEPIVKLRPDIPVELVNVVEKMLEKDVRDRYRHSSDVVRDLQQCLMRNTGAAVSHQFLNKLKRPVVAIPTVVVVLCLCSLGYWRITIEGKKHWARAIAIPEIERLAEEASMTANWAKNVDAFRLAKEAEKYVPNDTTLKTLYARFSCPMKVTTTPPGAAVYIQEYTSPQSEWEYLCITPLENVQMPWAFFRWKFIKKGYDTVFAVAAPSRRHHTLSRMLDTIGSIPQGMVRVHGDSCTILATEIPGYLNDYFIDKYEVTNEQYKKFMDAGGYKNRQYWEHEFVKGGKKIPWEEAMKEFIDATGRPGPATWQAGDYSEGQADFPVHGISWYEAAAFAEYAGKHLPTTDHWYYAAFPDSQTNVLLSMIGPLSNFCEGGPARVGAYQGMNAFGAYDMAGNVREWCWNETEKGRALQGGAWNDIPYMYTNWSQAPAFDRSPKNGVRCVRYLEGDRILDGPFGGRIEWRMRDFTKEKPVSDATFNLYRDQFSYDKADLNARIEERDSTAGDWIKEKITFDAVYGGDRMIAYVFLPKRSRPPYQAVIYFPGSSPEIWTSKSEDLLQLFAFDFIVKSGRAVVYPIYYGTYERNTTGVDGAMHMPFKEYTNRYTELCVKWVKDFKRTIDYLETRPDIDTAKIAYYGWSWGGRMGPVITATEPRLKASVLYLGGFLPDSYPRPEVDDLNYAQRVHVPTLLLSGKYDMIFPYEISVKPMFELLGTPPKDKLNKVYDTDHYIPRQELIKETLAWYEKYLGPVE